MSSGKSNHIGHQVIGLIDRLGVAPLIRNYHLFYMCISNSDPELRAAVRALGSKPTQDQIDEVIEKFAPDALGSSYMHRQQSDMIKNLDRVLNVLTTDQEDTESYTTGVLKVSETLARAVGAKKVTTDTITKIADVLVDASQSKVEAGKKTNAQVKSSSDEITQMRTELTRLQMIANTDFLTQLANRRAFDETLAACFAKENKSEIALLMLDVDHFKKINDTFSHAGGDKVLRLIADCLKANVRQGSVVARTGGEEFAVILRNTNLEDTRKAAERIRTSIEGLVITNKLAKGARVHVTVSVGASMASMAQTPEELYEAADLALYKSKNSGRNRVSLSEDVDVESSQRFNLYKT